MDNKELIKRIEKLEKELAHYRRFITITPTRVILNQSVLIQGMVNADRVYTKRTGEHIELTT